MSQAICLTILTSLNFITRIAKLPKMKSLIERKSLSNLCLLGLVWLLLVSLFGLVFGWFWTDQLCEFERSAPTEFKGQWSLQEMQAHLNENLPGFVGSGSGGGSGPVRHIALYSSCRVVV